MVAGGLRRILVSTGEASGDLILSKIIAELRLEAEKNGERLEFVGLCGPACVAQGVRPLADAKDVAVVGIVEVFKKLRGIFAILAKLRVELANVDSVLCVDLPDFNLRLAQIAQRCHVPVDYVIAPQVWAWRSGRIHKIRRLVRRLYPALPFEESIFREAGIDTHYLGHPMRDHLPPRNRRAARKTLGLSEKEFLFCVMPGSRRSEIDRSLPLILEAWSQLKRLRGRRPLGDYAADWRAVLPLAPSWTENSLKATLSSKDRAQLEALLKSGEWIISQNAFESQMASDFGWITSGTATLEAAYYQLPHILFYRLSGFTIFLIKSLSSYFSQNERMAGLPNILLGKSVLPELLQKDLSPRRLAIETIELLQDRTQLHHIKQQLRWIPKKMGEPGTSARIAKNLYALWRGKP